MIGAIVGSVAEARSGVPDGIRKQAFGYLPLRYFGSC